MTVILLGSINGNPQRQEGEVHKYLRKYAENGKECSDKEIINGSGYCYDHRRIASSEMGRLGGCIFERKRGGIRVRELVSSMVVWMNRK